MAENKPRWEVKYDTYKKENAKYEDMKKDLKVLKESKVTGDFKTKQEYQDAVDKRNKEISDKEKQVLGYDNFKKNENKIENILEYRNKLQEELDKLPQDNKESIASIQAEIDKNEKTLAEQEKRLDDLIKYVNSNPNSKDLVEKQEELSITANVVRNLKEQRGKLDTELQNLESNQKSYEEKIEPNKAAYERKIAKCNIIAANLLKGKELGEFEIKVEQEGKKFTSPDGKLPKETKAAREEKTYVMDPETGKFVLEEESVKPEEELEQEEYAESELEYDDEQAYTEPELEYDDEQVYTDVEPELVEENALVEKKSFAERHPILAKIGQFFKNLRTGVASRISNIFKKDDSFEVEKSLDDEDKEYEEFKELISKTKEDKDKEELQPIEEMDKENEFLKQIAEKGEKAAIEDRREAFRKQLAQRKLDAANEYAQKYGGRYEKQDGATAKKVETPETPEREEDDGLEL